MTFLEAKPGVLGQLSASVSFSDVPTKSFYSLSSPSPLPAGPLGRGQPSLALTPGTTCGSRKAKDSSCMSGSEVHVDRTPAWPKGRAWPVCMGSGVRPLPRSDPSLPSPREPARAFSAESCGSLERFHPAGRVSVESELISARHQRRLRGPDTNHDAGGFTTLSATRARLA